ncbi:hypothetical protein VP01_2392g3 [Puccinia sorghi]|uniref:Uncharacterized protein n=1 Tax=Puccinia sorghi TaxID=27349 RepID=A0A0L6V6V0_9BASI|nr:hypothetical protein VP01_2392g3 [Puccinia sorghi]
MGHHHQTSPSGKRTSLIHNARSLFIKLVHSQHASSKKVDEPLQHGPRPVEDAATETLTNQLPPVYEVAMQTPSHPPENALRDALHDPPERPTCSTAASDSMMLESLYPPPRSHTCFPLPSKRPSFVLPTGRNREDTGLLDDRRSLRPSSSRQSCSTSIHNPRPSNKRSMAQKLIKASSASSLNSSRHLGNNARCSSTRRDRELIAAKKSLPILT